MIKELFENDLGIMEGTFFQNCLGMKCMYGMTKRFPWSMLKKIFNTLITWKQSLCWIYVEL